MAIVERGGTFLAVLKEMAADERIVDELVAAARAQSPEVARLPIAENRRHIAVLLSAGLSAFERQGDPSERDFAEAARLGSDRAVQGIPIGALLSGIQAGRTRALEIAIARGRAADIADDVLLEVMLQVDRYTGALERHVIDGYHAAERELAHSRWEASGRLLRRLLLGERPEAPPEELARWGLRRDGRYHCVVSETSDASRLAAYRGVFGSVDGRQAGLTARLPSPDGDDQVALVVTAPACALPELPSVYELCVAAVRAGEDAGLKGPHRLIDLAGETALAAQPLLGRLLSAELLGGLKSGDDFHRELVSTALTYLDLGQRLDHTAGALHVHPNTVRYRLRRLQELVGISVAVEPGERLTVLETVRLWWALRGWLGEPDSR
jgi:DNA-binding PucR family transcriptional regulator